MNHQGKAVIFCAPSGAGKTTIVKSLIKDIPEIKFSISATTREKREGETDGIDYHFLSEDDFKTKISQGDVYEWQEVYQGTFYGTLKSEVERIWENGNHVIFDVDVIGGINLKKALGESAFAVFVSVKDVAVLESRLRKRNTETEATLKMRVGKAHEEMTKAECFDYVLFNHDLEVAKQEAKQVVCQFIEKG
ncbi:MAG: guanylate kinase [Cyclobacteriaceae bacterium]